jgi:hypothetical protein
MSYGKPASTEPVEVTNELAPANDVQTVDAPAVLDEVPPSPVVDPSAFLPSNRVVRTSAVN